MAVSAGLILLPAIWILRIGTAPPEMREPTLTVPTVEPSASPVIPTRAGLLAAHNGVRFGIAAPGVPTSSRVVNQVTSAAGARPTMLMYFAPWVQPFHAGDVAASYRQGALPMLTWEPWAGKTSGASQPAYSLAKIITGAFDVYLTSFATAVRDQRWPLVIRFGAEMNGDRYPWSESRSGNTAGQYVLAWRHVHDVFDRVGATNVIWLWCPSIVRSGTTTTGGLSRYYPGDQYVDWIGLDGYATTETTATAVFQPTVDLLRTFTNKPLLIAETGAQAGTGQVAWITDFFHWLSANPTIIGFVWFQYDRQHGASEDWLFTASQASTKAFHTGLSTLPLAGAPGGT